MFYVIEITDITTHETKFRAYDSHSGGYPWYPDNMQSAHLYRDEKKAKAALTDLLNTKPAQWTDNTFGAPHELRNVANMSNKKTHAKLQIKLVKVDGAAWSNVSVAVMSTHYVELKEYCNEPGKQPFISISEEPWS